MNKSLLLLAALTLCCSITSLQAYSKSWCHCMRFISHPVPERVITKVEVTPPSGRCRKTQVLCFSFLPGVGSSILLAGRIITRNGSKICVNPDAEWLTNLLETMKNKGSNSTLASTASPETS